MEVEGFKLRSGSCFQILAQVHNSCAALVQVADPSNLSLLLCKIRTVPSPLEGCVMDSR